MISGVGIMQVSRFPNHLYLFRATKSYTQSRIKRGTMMPAYNTLLRPPESLRTVSAAEDLIRYLPLYSRITLSGIVRLPCVASASAFFPASLCKGANRNRFCWSCLITNCTKLLHRLHAPSKNSTGWDAISALL